MYNLSRCPKRLFRHDDQSSASDLSARQFLRRCCRAASVLTLSLLVVLFTCYVMLAPVVSSSLYDVVLFHPVKKLHNLDNALADIKRQCGVSGEEIYFPSSDGVRLHGIYFALPGGRKTVLFSHGNGGNISHRLLAAAILLKCGVSVFLYDYEGYGQSSGKPSLAGMASDGISAFDYLVNRRKVSARDIVLYGESLGSGISCQILKARQAGGIIIESGFDSLYSVACEKLPWLRAYPPIAFPAPSLDNSAILSGVHPPLLILHGKKDALITPEHAINLCEASSWPKKLIIFSCVGHTDFPYCDAKHYFRGLHEFLQALP